MHRVSSETVHLLNQVADSQQYDQRENIVLEFFPKYFQRPPHLEIDVGEGDVQLLSKLFVAFVLVAAAFENAPRKFRHPASGIRLTARSSIVCISSTNSVSGTQAAND